MRLALAYAAVTGLFCAIFAVCVDFVTDVLSLTQVMALAFVSGFSGSMVARFVLGRNAGDAG